MEENKILCTVEELKKKTKAAEIKEKVKAKLDGVKEWIVNNPSDIIGNLEENLLLMSGRK